MTRVHILSAYPESRSNCVAEFLRQSALRSPDPEFALCPRPDEADLILFAESHPEDPLFYQVALHPLRRRQAEKCFLYSDADQIFPILRGLYPSLQKGDAADRRCRGAGYYGQVEVNPFVAPTPGEPVRLASFVGARTHPVRAGLLTALAGQSEFLLRDTTGLQSWTFGHEEKLRYQRAYAEELGASAFVLCPSGLGPSSYRIFETMKAGRCPVIISDAWTPPDGPDWSACSLRVAEARIADLPGILGEHRPEAAARGRAARAAWEAWFSPEAAFATVARQCREIQNAAGSPRYRWAMMFAPSVRRHALRGLRRQSRDLPGLLTRWLKA